MTIIDGVFCGDQLLYILMVIWDQCHVDIFLMDWEKPKGNIMAMIQQQQFLDNQRQQNQQQQPPAQYVNQQMMMQQNQFMAAQHGQPQHPQQWNHMASFDAFPQNQGSSRSVNMSPSSRIQQMRKQNNTSISRQVDSIGIISCWRKLIVANEWNELSLHRTLRPSTTLFLFLLFMVGFEFEYFSLETPAASGSAVEAQSTATSMVYKFVICSFVLMAIAVLSTTARPVLCL